MYSSQIFPSLIHDLYKVEAYPKEMIQGLLHRHPHSAIVLDSPLVFNRKSAHIYITDFTVSLLWKYTNLYDLYQNFAGEIPALSAIVEHLDNNVEVFDIKDAKAELERAGRCRPLTVGEATVLENFIDHHDYKHTYTLQKFS